MPSERQEQESDEAALTLQVEETYDAGLVAWIQCAGGFVLMMNSWGLANTFGIFMYRLLYVKPQKLI